MIYKVNKDTKRICLRIRRNGADDCCEKISLTISPLQCEQLEEPVKYQFRPCGGFEPVEKKREPLLTLVYDMFDRDEQGNVCFLLDSQFSKLACGRYNAVITACGCEVLKFQLDKREVFNVSPIITDDRSDCCEGRNGC